MEFFRGTSVLKIDWHLEIFSDPLVTPSIFLFQRNYYQNNFSVDKDDL